MLDPSDTTVIGLGVTAFVATIMAVFTFTTAYNEKPARILGYGTVFIALWAWIGFAYNFADSIWLAREIRILSIMAQIGAQICVVQFVFTYLKEVRPLERAETLLYNILMIGNGIVFLLYISDAFGTHFMVGELTGLPPETIAPQPGSLLLFFLGFWYVLSFSYAYILSRRIVLIQNPKRRRADIILAVGLVGAFLLGGFGFIIWYNITGTFTLLRVLALPFYCVAVFYAITNYQLFNLRVAAAEVFVFAIWGFIFLRILFQPSLSEAMPDIFILVAVVVLGLFLIRNVTQELETRIELEKVSEKLRVLNQSLEDKVKERTLDLERSRRHIEQMVDHMPVGIIETDDRQNIVRINDTAETLLELAKENVENTNITEHAVITDMIGTNLTNKAFETQITKPKTRDVEVVIAPLALERSEGYVIVLRDVTERRQLERAKSEFIATAAHQLRTPLSAIKWTFELLENEGLKKQFQDTLARGKQGVTNLERIAEALMMSIRTSERMDDYSFETTDVHPILENVVSMVQPLADKNDIALETDIAETLPELSLDTERLGFAIQNLADNAIRYTEAGGTVTISAWSETNSVVITVADTGIGISAEDQERLFEKFFRSKKATEMSTDGSGLGLFITKSVIEAHGGTLAVDSEEGVGTTFTITIPVHTGRGMAR